MSTWKLVALLVAWTFTALAIGVVTAIVLTEMLRLVGVVRVGHSSYSIALNTIALGVFVVLVAVPLLFRERFANREDHPQNEVGSRG
ncbi:MAG: hypothetical protein QGD89_00015 [Actinomycetota bacterium]|nr:hypothetical protein [Actinomycetota bacterium]